MQNEVRAGFVEGAFTHVTLEWAGAGSNGMREPVTFGFVFRKGDVPAGMTIEAIGEDGLEMPIQMDVKTRYDDGSVCHAVLSMMIEHSISRSAFRIYFRARPATRTQVVHEPVTPDVHPEILIVQNGVRYRASSDTVIGDWQRQWLDGPIVQEHILPARLIDESGNTHPRLHAAFHVRHYPSMPSTRIDFVVENTWSYVPNPANETYDVELRIDGQPVASIRGLKHHHHARWHREYWTGGRPSVHARLDVPYLVSTGAVPSYDLRIHPSERLIRKILRKVEQSDTSPMGYSIVTKYMGTAGGRPDLGPLPRWSAVYLLSQDRRMLDAMLRIADSAGSWNIHYRDRSTGLPLSIDDHPRASWFPASTGADTDTPSCRRDCDTGAEPDVAHLPDLAYLPYLVTGDYFYLEELQFWADHVMLQRNPEYREYARGLLKSHATRGQAWGMRTLAYAAFVTPDDHPLKHYFTGKLNNNLDWYTATYTRPGVSPKYNPTGRLVYQWQKDSLEHKLWMDDFFTWTMGQIVDLGFEKARPMLLFKSRTPVGRMGQIEGDEGWCWAWAAPYRTVGGNSYTDTFTTAYLANRDAEKWIPPEQCPGPGADMFKYPTNPQGYVAILGAALAVAVDAGLPGARRAWALFESRARKPDWDNKGPDFAIVPRGSTP